MPEAAAVAEAGSFRDRDGRIYYHNGRVLRGLSEAALNNYRQLQQAPFFRQLCDSGELIGTREVAGNETHLPAQVLSQWAGFLEHDRVAVISYPYEWSFSMLRDAALLQLKLVEQAVEHGFILKDASPYNIQFIGRRPVFIDIPSFEPLAEGAPWAGYRQFCEMYLFALMLQAYRNCKFQPLMRSAIDGIDLQTAATLFSARDRLRKGVLTHVWLQSRLDRRYGGSAANVRADLKSAGFNREMILVNLRKLKKLVAGLQWDAAGSEWGDYADFHNYSAADHEDKAAFVRDAVAAERPGTLWDIGCNTGQFSQIAAEHCAQVVAMDLDHVAVERLYLNTDSAPNILPLVHNLADPSPQWGWKNRERTDLAHRARPDFVLCLALVHHVVITANIPLSEFVDWLADLTDALVIEYVSRRDDKVQTLLRNKEDQYTDYSRQNLEACLGRHFDVRRQQRVSNGNRTLYFCARTARRD